MAKATKKTAAEPHPDPLVAAYLRDHTGPVTLPSGQTLEELGLQISVHASNLPEGQVRMTAGDLAFIVELVHRQREMLGQVGEIHARQVMES